MCFSLPTVVAFFDIHKQGVDPYRCGDLNMDGFQQFLAFMYSYQDLFYSSVLVSCFLIDYKFQLNQFRFFLISSGQSKNLTFTLLIYLLSWSTIIIGTFVKILL